MGVRTSPNPPRPARSRASRCQRPAASGSTSSAPRGRPIAPWAMPPLPQAKTKAPHPSPGRDALAVPPRFPPGARARGAPPGQGRDLPLSPAADALGVMGLGDVSPARVADLSASGPALCGRKTSGLSPRIASPSVGRDAARGQAAQRHTALPRARPGPIGARAPAPATCSAARPWRLACRSVDTLARRMARCLADGAGRQGRRGLDAAGRAARRAYQPPWLPKLKPSLCASTATRQDLRAAPSVRRLRPCPPSPGAVRAPALRARQTPH